MEWNEADLMCSDLLTHPIPEVGTILVTGATGYVGGRLVRELLARGYHVRVMARVAPEVCRERWPEAEVVMADALNIEELLAALEGVHTAYYLIHSLLLGPSKFETADTRAALNFGLAAEANDLSRVIYLGGLGDTQSLLSPHLRSRREVAEQLRSRKVATTELRAAIIIGSGSAPYEILKNLVKRSPIFFMPYWAKTKCQPISIRGLISVLVGVLETEETTGKSYDIGGNEILTYEMMLRILSQILGKKKLFIPTSFSSTRFYSYIASLLTPVPAGVIRALMEGCRNEVVCKVNNALPTNLYHPITFKEAIVKAMTREEQDAVHTRWSDEHPRAHELAIKLHELKKAPHYISSYTRIMTKPVSALFESICRIGGSEGWFHANWMWRLRGLLDRLLLGVGSSRGRRSGSSLRVNDVVDFWRVERLAKNRNLLLRAEMKLPGMAWLEFKIDEEERNDRLTLIAYFEPHGLPGKLYWYNFLPFHYFIFENLLEQLDRTD